MLRMIVYAGEIGPVPALVLTDQAGNPVNLDPLTSLTFRMINRHNGVTVVDATAVKAQVDGQEATWGQVYYQWTTTDTATPGLYRAWFVVDQGSGPTRYPLEEDFLILIKPASGPPA